MDFDFGCLWYAVYEGREDAENGYNSNVLATIASDLGLVARGRAVQMSRVELQQLFSDNHERIRALERRWSPEASPGRCGSVPYRRQQPAQRRQQQAQRRQQPAQRRQQPAQRRQQPAQRRQQPAQGRQQPAQRRQQPAQRRQQGAPDSIIVADYRPHVAEIRELIQDRVDVSQFLRTFYGTDSNLVLRMPTDPERLLLQIFNNTPELEYTREMVEAAAASPESDMEYARLLQLFSYMVWVTHSENTRRILYDMMDTIVPDDNDRREDFYDRSLRIEDLGSQGIQIMYDQDHITFDPDDFYTFLRDTLHIQPDQIPRRDWRIIPLIESYRRFTEEDGF